MTCQEAQADLSLYLYGELDFAQEEAYEAHLAECSFCQLTLNREKTWHATLNTQQKDVPLDLLSDCRQQLRTRCGLEGPERASIWTRLPHIFGFRFADFRTTAWSFRLAAASLLVMLGFLAGRVVDRFYAGGGQPEEAGLINFADSPVTRIQNIRAMPNKGVRILVEQVRNGEISGSPEDEHVRELLLAAARESLDPGIRVDSVEMLAGQNGQDVRDALIASIQNDPNAAVRLKALQGLRSFSMDPAVRNALKFVLSHDRDAGVRTEAIDVLVPADQSLLLTPELLQTLQDVMRMRQEDDYVRARCLQALQGQGLRTSGDAY
jgi:hypothetical protein